MGSEVLMSTSRSRRTARVGKIPGHGAKQKVAPFIVSLNLQRVKGIGPAYAGSFPLVGVNVKKKKGFKNLSDLKDLTGL